jgi:chromosome segregation ATPase
MQFKSQQDGEMNEKIVLQVHSLEEENSRLQSLKDIEKQKSDSKLKEINDQITQLNTYKTALETEITKREDKISTLKGEITTIVEEEDKKRNSIKMIQERRSSKLEGDAQKQLEIQAEYFHKIIKDLSDELTELKQNTKKRYNETPKDPAGEIKQLKSELAKKSEEIYQIKNETAVSRLRCDSLKSEQEVERVSWATEKKNLEIKLERQIQNLLRDLSLERQTV